MKPTKLKIATLHEAKILTSKWRKDQQKIVFTNGCFDILHLGHIDYLEKARSLGDKLIVGLNSDDSARRLKGDERPINDLNARSLMLAALDFVDAVVPFEEDTPLTLISTLLPDMLIKGGDYQKENIVGANVVIESGGSVETFELVKGYSTTAIINKLKHN